MTPMATSSPSALPPVHRQRSEPALGYAEPVMDWATRNATIMAEFRANDGVVGEYDKLPIIILHTIGAKSGLVRETPLVVGMDDDGLHIFASKAGSQSHPAWYYNLKAHPEITVEFGAETYRARLDQLDPEIAERKIIAMAEILPQFAGYVEKARPRVIPAFSITRLG